MTATLNRSAAFLLGFSFAFLPSFGPFLAVLFFLASRWTFNRSDLVWGAAALCSALSLGVHTGLEGFAFGVLQIMGPWLVYRAFFHLRRVPLLPANAAAVTSGLVAGLVVVVGAGWLQMGRLNFAYKPFTQAVIWSSSPAFYGHTVFVLGALVAVLTAEARFRFLGLGLSAVGILVAGSREAAVAWVVVTVVLFWVRRGRSKRSLVAEVVLLSVMLVVAAGLGPWFGWGRFGFLLDILPSSGSNLIQGSEIPNGDWWDTTWVGVRATDSEFGGTPLTTYEVTKKGSDGWLRLQQVVPVEPGEPYTLSTWLRPEGESQPGVQGWGQLLKSNQTFTLSAALVGDHWQAGATGPGRVLNAGIAAAAGDWRRVFVTFVYEGEPLLYWYVGLAPDRRQIANSSATFAGFQLEPGAALSDYTPGAATKGLSLGVARIPYWQAAWQGIRAKPWLGWGPDSFPDYYRLNWPNNRKLRSLPSHAHNFFLHILFERGLLGFLGVTLLIFALLWGTLKTLDVAFLAVVSAVLFINVFDVTLFYGGVLYPLVAVAGWRAATVQPRAEPTGYTTTRQLGVSLGLAVTDFGMAYLAFLGALVVLHPQDLVRLADPFSVTTYALLLWPVMVWREGLYPGYGLTAPQELRKQVVAATYAGLLLAAGTVLFGQDLPVPRSGLVLTFMLSMGLLVLGRAVLKRLLLRADLWGRPVFILGAGRVGSRLVRVLERSPLEGLRPVAFFDDDPLKQGRTLSGLPVLGSLAAADDYARRWGVNHAVVAIPTMSPALLSDFIHRRSRAFRHLQFVPELSGLPAQDVSASPLAGFLALEFRNGLYSRSNRLFKRWLDLLGSVTATLLSAPLLLALTLWVRFDSAGPAFHASERVGQRGAVFRCFKFRTMYADAEERLQELLDTDEQAREEYALYHKLEHDPRVTRAGRVLRRYSLDELPQVFNVLNGTMSLVGPRPYLTRELRDIGVYGETIFEAKPGITGYWQVSGRSTVTFQERLEMESHYVRNWSIWWDIVLLSQTPLVVLDKRGAH